MNLLKQGSSYTGMCAGSVGVFHQLSYRLQTLDGELYLSGSWLSLLVSCNPLLLHYVVHVCYLIVSNFWMCISVAVV